MADQDPSSDTEDLFASPSAKAARQKAQEAQSTTPKTPKSPTPGGQQQAPSAKDREAALQRELEGVREINALISGVVSTLERGRGNMNTVSQTVTNASTLLNSWTRILSQTEHNQRLILNSSWKGASADTADAEGEIQARQEAERLRAADFERRRAEAARRKEDEDRARDAAANAPTRGTRGRGRTTRGTARGTTRGGIGGTSSGYGSVNTTSSRGTSSIGRGTGSTRGRPRGTRGI